ncbi:MAG: restriction endonuclease subunit S [Endozoicomonas sp.]|uniref:restriction endonuclease subunit S n=1 Tax=Endozoicomonas sp. TaxID=1892382 RepID=UPI003D9ADD0C
MSFQQVALKELVMAHYGKALKKDDRNESGFALVYGSSGHVGNHSSKICVYPTLIVGRKGSVGKVVWAPEGGWIIDTAYFLEILDQKTLDLRYLFYALKRANLASRTITTSIPGLNREDFYQTKIPLPPLPEQKRIAAILDKADQLRQKRQQAIGLADEFLRSVFLDIFGDPVTNPKGWELKKLSEFYVHPKTGTKCGPFGSALKKDEYQDEGIPVWNMDNISLKGKFIDSPNLWISEKKFNELEQYGVEVGDIIISRAGTVGKMGVVRSRYPQSIISTNLIRLRFGNDLLPEYFVSLMIFCKGRVGNLKTGPDGSFTHMNTGILDKLVFPYPSIETQRKYIDVYNRVTKFKSRLFSGVDTTTNLFNSVSQKAFAGEL